MVLRRVKAKLRDKLNAAVAEVGDNDLWQRAALGVTVVGNERTFTESALDEAIRFIAGELRGAAEVTNVERELQTFNDVVGEGPDFERIRR